MKLEEIGFYTLSDERARKATIDTQLMRCELILTDTCNFKCPYCRGLREDIKGTLPFSKALDALGLWCDDNLQNVRFSGGEPTMYEGLPWLVQYAKENGVKRIALSTNGSAENEYYKELIEAGVNDISISLDACCANFGEKMAGGIKGAWEKVVYNLRDLSKICYITTGIVVTDDNYEDLPDIVKFADELGVADIRVISAAQSNKMLEVAKLIPEEILLKHPILKYRVGNITGERNVRGIQEHDCSKCGLVLDDIASAGGYHFPCIIYMREGGDPIGKIGPNMRGERMLWYAEHNTHLDPICKGNCLDVCIDYNNKFEEFRK